MLRLPAFEYCAARTVDEAATLLASHGPRAMVVAGGTDLYPNMKRRQQEPSVVIGLRGISELSGVARSDGALRIALGQAIDLSAQRRLLDLGGGTGGMSIALCRRFPGWSAIVDERPPRVPIARAGVADRGLADRLSRIVEPGGLDADRDHRSGQHRRNTHQAPDSARPRHRGQPV